MATSSLDSELIKSWSLLTPVQKESLLMVIKSFMQSPEIKNHELQEPQPLYGNDDKGLSLEILQQLSWEQKEALIKLIESFGIEVADHRISPAQYNKEIDEADAEFAKGESVSHEEVVAMTKKWMHGK